MRSIKFTPLEKISVASSASYSFYAVVLDATIGYRNFDICVCSLKIIDPTCYYTNDEEDNESTVETVNTGSSKKTTVVTNTSFCCVTIFANNAEQLPRIKKVGDIIRIIKAKCTYYKGMKQFNVNLHYSSSVVVFDGDEMTNEELKAFPTGRYKPYHCSRKTFDFTKDEEKLLQGTRDWSNDFFSKNIGFPSDMFTTLDKVKEKKSGEIDVHCQVVAIETQYVGRAKLSLRDQSGVLFKMAVREKDQWDLHVNDVIRIRSAVIDSYRGSKLELHIQPKSNIMKFLKTSKLSHQLLDEVTLDEKILRMMLCDEEKEILDHRRYISKVTDMHKTLPITSLFEIYHGNRMDGNIARAKFYILNVQPYDAREFVQGFCHVCVDTFSLKNLVTHDLQDEETKSNQVYCPTCKNKSELIYMLQFLVKDDSTEHTAQFYKVLLYSFQGKCDRFFGGNKPVNLYKNEKSCEILKKYVKLLTKFNIYIDGVLEKRQESPKSPPYFLLVETELERKYIEAFIR
ncbi:unnamed protein product [Moneuplotes crassus]|uniref:Telomeric single stranded DNA binding POT1/Cdc13 domain-containing protein n=1 Tax=Euplotes crassus TaxID=5936 RepID=A0AAD1X8J7_EUPCR|nr:unnamed protein product [Moneuplotes crassus]